MVLVVFNNADPQSVNLAAYYAEKRGIPFDHLVGLDCPLAEEISRETYDKTIANPLRKTLTDRGWWRLGVSGSGTFVVENTIRFVALIRGMPLKIAQTTAYPGDRQEGLPEIASKNEASVDSELAALGYFSSRISGALTNPYYRSYTPFPELSCPALMLVCRLDAPDAENVRRMIDDSIETEKNGLRGFAYVDGRGITEGALAEGDRWLEHLAVNERRHGIPVVFDRSPAMFPEAYPMEHAAFYYGWYSEQPAGPFVRDDFRFVRGAVACHIHSSSALSLRDPHKYWVAPLIAHGAAAAMGNVYEPYLALTPNLDVFDDRLQSGFNFAESAYMAQRVISWMTTFVGDPLYRPFKQAQDLAASPPDTAREWADYREGALLWFNQNRAAGENKLRMDGTKLRSGIVFEGLGLLQAAAGDFSAAFQSFREARKYYTDGGDIVRTLIHEVGFLKADGRTAEALTLARRGAKAYAKFPATAVLRSIEAELAPTPMPAKEVRK